MVMTATGDEPMTITCTILRVEPPMLLEHTHLDADSNAALLDLFAAPEIRRLKQLEDENSKLKRLVADLTLNRSMLQDVFKRKW